MFTNSLYSAAASAAIRLAKRRPPARVRTRLRRVSKLRIADSNGLGGCTKVADLRILSFAVEPTRFVARFPPQIQAARRSCLMA
jgi:hypothetical protein